MEHNAHNKPGWEDIAAAEVHGGSATHLQCGDHALAILQDLIHLCKQVVPKRYHLQLLLKAQLRPVLHTQSPACRHSAGQLQDVSNKHFLAHVLCRCVESHVGILSHEAGGAGCTCVRCGITLLAAIIFHVA